MTDITLVMERSLIALQNCVSGMAVLTSKKVQDRGEWQFLRNSKTKDPSERREQSQTC